MAGKFQVPKGTFDILPKQFQERKRLELIAEQIFTRACYQRIETPTFEATELFARGVGESTDVVQKEMYSFDDGAGRSLTLRPEGTASICRAYIEHGMHKQPQPVKLWYYGSFYRSEAPQAGRYRQFWQIGAEAIGSDDPALDAESICLLNEILTAAGATDLQLRIGTLGSSASRTRYREVLIDYLNRHRESLSSQVVERIELNPLRAFDSSHPGTNEIMKQAPLLIDHLDAEDLEHFQTVKELLDTVGVSYSFDPRLVRGLDYYQRTVFEFTAGSLGAQSGVGGGGRYDGLTAELGGQPAAAIGWAAGVERILLSAASSGKLTDSSEAEPRCDLFVAVADQERLATAFELANFARRCGLSVQQELAGRSLKGQFKLAGRLGSKNVLIVGQELELKQMSDGQQQSYSLSELKKRLMMLGKTVER